MSNPSMISFLTTLLLAAALCTHGQEAVKDTAGNPVKAGEKYFIQPVKTSSNNGGGLVPAAINILPFCPLGITQTLLPYQPGLPVIFTLPDDTTDVKTSTALYIEFESDLWPVCNDFPDSKLWVVADSDAKEPPILIGGVKGSKNSKFLVEKDGENTYKFTTSDGIVGATPGAWINAPQLLLTKDATKTVVVKFKKVDDVTTAATSMSRVEKLGIRMFPFY